MNHQTNNGWQFEEPEPPIWEQVILGAAISGAFLASVFASYLIVGSSC